MIFSMQNFGEKQFLLFHGDSFVSLHFEVIIFPLGFISVLIVKPPKMLGVAITFHHLAFTQLLFNFLLLEFVERKFVQFFPPFQIKPAKKCVVFVIVVVLAVVGAVFFIVKYVTEIVIVLLIGVYNV